MVILEPKSKPSAAGAVADGFAGPGYHGGAGGIEGKEGKVCGAGGVHVPVEEMGEMQGLMFAKDWEESKDGRASHVRGFSGVGEGGGNSGGRMRRASGRTDGGIQCGRWPGPGEDSKDIVVAGERGRWGRRCGSEPAE